MTNRRDNPAMTDDQLLRYSRHILLEEIGIEGQQRLLASHALVIGAGGLGSPVALYLGTAGVGRITLVDHDAVDLTNLQRQIAHSLARVGSPRRCRPSARWARSTPKCGWCRWSSAPMPGCFMNWPRRPTSSSIAATISPRGRR